MHHDVVSESHHDDDDHVNQSDHDDDDHENENENHDDDHGCESGSDESHGDPWQLQPLMRTGTRQKSKQHINTKRMHLHCQEHEAKASYHAKTQRRHTQTHTPGARA